MPVCEHMNALIEDRMGRLRDIYPMSDEGAVNGMSHPDHIEFSVPRMTKLNSYEYTSEGRDVLCLHAEEAVDLLFDRIEEWLKEKNAKRIVWRIRPEGERRDATFFRTDAGRDPRNHPWPLNMEGFSVYAAYARLRAE